MDSYFFINPLSGEEILYVPRVFVAKFLESKGSFKVNYNPKTLSRYVLKFMKNNNPINKGLEWGLIQEVDVEDNLISEFIGLCNLKDYERAETKAEFIFACVQADLEDCNSEYILEEDEDEEDEEWKLK